MAKQHAQLHASPVAIAYAQSLMELADDRNQAEAVGAELVALRQIVDENPSFREVLTNPAIPLDERAHLLDEKLGTVEVDLTVAQRLTSEQLEQAKQRISQALGRDAVVHQYVDENVLGGVVLRVGDKLIDASVRYQLQAMKEQLLAAAP